MTERHAVLFTMYNTTSAQLDLSKQALASILSQDIGALDVFIVNNGSNQETANWLNSLPQPENGSWLYVKHFDKNTSPCLIANEFMKTIFLHHDYVLGVPNDVILPKSCYRLMLACPRGFVGAQMHGSNPPKEMSESHVVHEDIHMSVMLTRKWAHDALVSKDGYFLDPGYFLYGSDVDMKMRLAACGIRPAQLDVECWHFGSACWRLATEEVGRAINIQADKDRAYFAEKWGHAIGNPWCGEMMNNIDFRGEPLKSKIWTSE